MSNTVEYLNFKVFWEALTIKNKKLLLKKATYSTNYANRTLNFIPSKIVDDLIYIVKVLKIDFNAMNIETILKENTL